MMALNVIGLLVLLCSFAWRVNGSTNTMTRWGKTDCPTGYNLLYNGVTGGGGQDSGNGFNMMCLPLNASYIQGGFSIQDSTGANLYRAEYYTLNLGIASFNKLHLSEVPCAVCQRQREDAKSFLLTGRVTCPTGFTADYRGYLFGPNSYKSQFLCIDENAEGYGSSGDESGMYLYPTEAAQGGLLGYTSYLEITCAYCSSNAASGSIYTRWGRTTCPSSATLVFDGLTSGARHNNNNGGSEYLCMHKIPEYLQKSTVDNSGPEIFRTEYETSANAVSAAWTALQNWEAPCVICQNAVGRNHSLIVPGRTDCPTGFSLDYSGYIMSHGYTQTKGEYICVDDAPEKYGSSADEDGNLLYFVESDSGSSVIPGYTAFLELSCAHCTVNDKTGGSTYVRWGRTSCGGSDTLIYTGVGASSHYSHTGSGTNFLCFHPVPKYSTTNPAAPSTGYIYRGEFETSSSSFYNYRALQDYDLSCSVCQRPPARSNSIMIAGQYTCPAGMTTDYYGFLLADNNYRQEYLCIDYAAEKTGSASSENGALLYMTEFNNNFATYDKYLRYYEMTCAICSVPETLVVPPPPPPPPPVAGPTYIRWGRTTCPTGSTLVYNGVTGGAAQDLGNGYNMQCLPMNPDYSPGAYSIPDSSGGNIYRAEYYTNSGGIPTFVALHASEMPCAVCQRNNDQVKSFMLHGRYTCPSGFSADYKGYLFAPNSYKANYICVDENAEPWGSSGDEGYMYLYPVESASGAFAGYVNYQEITCALCVASSATGSIYTRWGRTVCPAGDTYLYDGYVGSSHYTGSGGLDHMCLHKIPQYLQATTADNTGSEIFRTEYETSNNQVTAAYNALQDYEVPCVVCQNPDEQKYGLMVPGRSDCPSGFVLDYTGYLMAQLHTQTKSEAICVDLSPEKIGSAANENGQLLYFMEMDSGQWTLPGYNQFWELSCAQCVTEDASGGSTYVRWGRSVCPANHDLIYTGPAAVSYFRQAGSASTFLCFHPYPLYQANYNPGGVGSYIYRVEYEVSDAAYENFRPVHDYEMTCAVCQRPSDQSHAVTVPAKMTCPAGYTMDYSGYLMAAAYYGYDGSYYNWRTEYVCVDSSPEADGSSSSENPGLIYPIEFLGAFELDGYRQYYELTCSVCSGYTVGQEVPPPPPAPPVVAQGSTYVRWGRTTCPSNAQLLYTGVTGGSAQDSGGGYNMQCLPLDPYYAPGNYSFQDTSSGNMYRAEYYTSGGGISSFAVLHLNEVPCAVCKRVKDSVKSYMHPGKTSCPSGFDMDYRGYLFAPNSYKGNFLCFDENSEPYGSSGDEGGMYMYAVESASGSGSLPGYQGYAEITCAVCTASTKTGSIYVRWGRTTCPGKDTAIYDGFTGGARYNYAAGGAEYLCMTKSPEYLLRSSVDNAGSEIYQTEYEMGNSVSSYYTSLQDYEAPCVVCQNPDGQSYSLMVPGRPDCPDGFQLDYYGYLMAHAYSQQKAEFVCVDNDAERIGTSTSEDGNLFYFVEADSGGASVSGYTQFLEISCAMCSTNDVTGGSTYVRWGRSTCPDDNTLLYTGSSGGAYYTHSGTASNALCFHPFPKYTITNPNSAGNGYVYKGEYEMSDAAYYYFRALHNWDVPCAVCQRPAARSNSLMISGKWSCPNSYSIDYIGFLNSAYCCSTHRRSEFTCMDIGAEQYGSSGGEDGFLFYAVEFIGQSTLDGWQQYQELTCVSCSACAGDSYTVNGKCLQATPCNPGSYASSAPTASSDRSCDPCVPGTYANTSNILTACTPCPSNLVQPSSGQTACVNCLDGFYRTSASTQTACNTGYYCKDCVQTPCDAGTYQDQGQQSSCVSCPTSQIQPKTGQTACVSCTDGYYRTSATAQAICELGYRCPGQCSRAICLPGTYQPGTGQSTCLDCPSGKYQDNSGQTSCKLPNNGYYISAPSAQTACPPGSYCINGTQYLCDGVTQYQDGTGLTYCKNASLCAAGYYASKSPTSQSNRECSACTLGTGYMDLSGNINTACKPVRTCSVGTYQTGAPTITSDRSCSSCNGISQYQDQTGQTSCKTVKLCRSGEYMSQGPTSSSDRVCSSCQLGVSYQATDNHVLTSCTLVGAVCAPGTYEQTAATLTSDRKCTTCSAGTYQDQSGQSSCINVPGCNIGQYLVANATLSSNRVCANCDGINFYQDLANQIKCKSVSNCTGTQYISTLATLTSDRKCTACTVATSCMTTEFLNGTCGGFSNPQCKPCDPTCGSCTGPDSNQCKNCTNSLIYDSVTSSCSSNCPTNQYKLTAGGCANCNTTCYRCDGPNGTNCLACTGSRFLSSGSCVTTCPAGYYPSNGTLNDNRCIKCTVCSGESYATQACKLNTDTVCSSASKCNIGQEEQAAPTPTTDRICQACNSTVAYQDQASQLVCKVATVCGPGTFVKTASTVSSDRACSDCLRGTAQNNANQLSCPSCNAGTYQDLTGQSVCKDCGFGYFQSSQMQTSCNVIGAGYYGTGGSVTQRTGQSICSPGSYCTGGGAAPVPCSGTTDYQDNAQQTSCKNVAFCQSGQYEKTPPTVTSNRVCSSCPNGTYQSRSNHAETSCPTFSVCLPGSKQTSAPSVSADRICTQCTNGADYQDGTNQLSCKSVTTCTSGYQQTTAPTTSSDRVCSACVQGTSFSAYGGPCVSVTHCSKGQRELTAPTTSTDRVCTPCDGVTGYQDAADATSCKTISSCTAGTYMSTLPSATNDRGCSPCPPNYFQSLTSHTQTACQQAKMCGAGEYQSTAPTVSTDRQCGSCVLNVTYQSSTSHNSTTCPSVKFCTKGQRETDAPTLTSDRVCVACILGLTYQPLPNKTSCLTVSTCTAGTAETAPPAVDVDRQCTACDGVSFYQDQSGQNSCKTISTCTGSQYVKTLPSSSSNRVCQNCTLSSQCRVSEFLSGNCGGQGGVENTQCVSCYTSCATCLGANSTQCLTCPTNYVFRNGSCLSSCSNSEYNNNGVCTPCDSSCTTCLTGGNNGCSSCSGTLYLNGTTCLSSCPAGYFKDATTHKCTKCSSCIVGLNFVTSTCNATNDAVCTSVTQCTVGQRENTGPTLTSDRTCIDCNGNTEYQNQPSQVTCKTATKCDFPLMENVATTKSSDRTCKCDFVGCNSQVSTAYQQLVCKNPDTTTLNTMISDCCAGQTSDYLKTLIAASSDYTARHSCNGCTSTCACTAGYKLVTVSGTQSCVACDGVTEFAAQGGVTTCTPVTTCSPGSQQTQAPTSSSDRVCSSCQAGYIDDDTNGATPCKLCPAGVYTAPGSTGLCSKFACGAGTVDDDSNPGTPCVSCILGVTFQANAGQTVCANATVCPPGQEEYFSSTLYADRLCQSCQLGKTYKASAGQSIKCTSVASCPIGQEEAAAPTTSSDRVCQACTVGVNYKAVNGDAVKCANVTQCLAGEEENLSPTAASDRTCKACVQGVSFKTQAGQGSRCVSTKVCGSAEYASQLPTVTSDRVCTPLSSCSSYQFISTPSTPSSDRVCTNCTLCPGGRFVTSECTTVSDRQCQGCGSCVDGSTYRSSTCTSSTDTVCTPCRVCETGLYQVQKCTALANTVCASITACSSTQYELRAPTSTSDRVCATLTTCDYSTQYDLVPATTSSDRVCATLTQCVPGQQIVREATQLLDRKCAACPAGSVDSDGDPSTVCVGCLPGVYVPLGSVGSCSSYVCSAGQADRDNNPATPCAYCDYGVSYSPSSGSSCLPVKNCTAGEQELVKPTIYANRICTSCILGVTFKANSGNVDACVPLRVCANNEYEVVAPTLSSDRTCALLTVCQTGEYESKTATYASNRLCTNVTLCDFDAQYQLSAATPTSNTLCKALGTCSSTLQYESILHTATTDRTCSLLTPCASSQFEIIPPTPTTNRKCVDLYSFSFFFDALFSTYCGTTVLQNTFISDTKNVLSRSNIDVSKIVSLTVRPGSIIAKVETYDEATFVDVNNLLIGGNITVQGLTATPCPTGQYLSSPIVIGFPATCSSISSCPSGQKETAKPSTTSDRLCADSGASNSSSSGASLSTSMLSLIVILLILIVVIVAAVLYVRHRKQRSQKKKQQQAAFPDPLHRGRQDMLFMNPMYEQGEQNPGYAMTRPSNYSYLDMGPGGGYQDMHPASMGQGQGYMAMSPGQFAGYLDIMPNIQAPWMVGLMDREGAEKKLLEMHCLPGDFIVRQSPRSPGYVLSMCKAPPNKFEHHKLTVIGGVYHIDGFPLRKEIRDLEALLLYLAREMDQTSVLLNPPHDLGDHIYGTNTDDDDLYGKPQEEPQQNVPRNLMQNPGYLPVAPMPGMVPANEPAYDMARNVSLKKSNPYDNVATTKKNAPYDNVPINFKKENPYDMAGGKPSTSSMTPPNLPPPNPSTLKATPKGSGPYNQVQTKPVTELPNNNRRSSATLQTLGTNVPSPYEDMGGPGVASLGPKDPNFDPNFFGFDEDAGGYLDVDHNDVYMGFE